MGEDAALLGIVSELFGAFELEAFRRALLGALGRLIPADWVSLNDVRRNPDEVTVISEPAPPAELLAQFAAHAHENPLVRFYQRTGDGRPLRLSDLVTSEQLHRLELYRRVYRPLAVEYQMAFTLPSGADRVLGIALSRRTRDFTDAERQLADRARPYLIQAYRDAVEHSELLALAGGRPPGQGPDTTPLRSRGLSQRECEVLARLATGAAGRDIAESLGIGLRTVEKHLENSYRRLGVRTRAEAAAVVWQASEIAAGQDVGSAGPLAGA